MKKMLLMAASVVIMTVGFGAKAEGVVDKVCLYIPNRIIDAFDTFSCNIGFGPVARAELRGTRAVQGGAGVGASAKVIKDYNRQYGACLQNGWDWSFICVAAEDIERKPTTRWVKEYWEHAVGFPDPSSRIYNFHTGARDYWELGASLALFVEADIALHPVDLADFVTGFLFIDLKGDDLTFEDFE
jgi:hypothetical protein